MTMPSPPSRPVYAGLFLVTLATLTYELVLTRIFSVMIWYHFAFVAVSLAMFGLSVGAVLIYIRSRTFPEDSTERQLFSSALLFGASIAVSLPVLIWLPKFLFPYLGGHTITLLYPIAAIPFIFSGISICLALTRYPAHVGRLYSADLAGSALGCVALIYVMKVADGSSTVLFAAAAAAVGGCFFAKALGANQQFCDLASNWRSRDFRHFRRLG